MMSFMNTNECYSCTNKMEPLAFLARKFVQIINNLGCSEKNIWILGKLMERKCTGGLKDSLFRET